jgi:hypothetical protein
MIEMDFFQYKIRSGDTLNSISSRLDMTAEELKIFHNAHCGKMEKLWFNNLHGVKHLLVPVHSNTEIQETPEKLSNTFSAQLPHLFFAGEYKVQEVFEYPQKPSLTIEYAIRLNGKEKNEKGQIITFSRKDVQTNGEIPEDKISILTLACMESIQPIDFILHDNGAIAGFQDHKTVKYRFNEKRKDLDDYFTGETNRTYIDLFQESITDENFLLQQFCTTLLFQTLFPTMDWFQKDTPWTESFYFFQNSFPAKCKMEAVHHAKNKDLKEIRFTGKIIEACSLQELKRGIRFHETSEENVSGEIRLQYTSGGEHNNIIQAEALLILWHQEIVYQKHHLTITQG